MQRYGDRLLGYWEGREADAAEIVQVMEARVETKVDRGRSTRRSTDNSAGENVTAESAPERPMQLEEPETEAMEVDARPPASEQEPLTPIAPSTTRQPSAPDPPPQAPPPSAPSAAQPGSLPRSKERGPVRQSTLTFAEPQPTSSVGLAHGLRDWVRGDEVMGVMGNRMTSPMRD